jgi:hypothetical protein
LSVLLVALASCRGEGAGQTGFVIPGEPGPRVTVEVLNMSAEPGRARIATRVLRRAGIDVLGYGTAPAPLGLLDSTRIVVRRGTAAVGERVRRALGVGRVAVVLDSAKLLDVSVLLGADFTPPRLNFHP